MNSKRAAQYTRSDIAQMLADIGEPGKKRDEKLEKIKQLNIANSQGINITDTLDSYPEW